MHNLLAQSPYRTYFQKLEIIIRTVKHKNISASKNDIPSELIINREGKYVIMS